MIGDFGLIKWNDARMIMDQSSDDYRRYILGIISRYKHIYPPIPPYTLSLYTPVMVLPIPPYIHPYIETPYKDSSPG